MAGELIETAWAEANNIGPSTREMTPGHRHDVLNDLYDFWNWWKVTQMGKWLYSQARLDLHSHITQYIPLAVS